MVSSKIQWYYCSTANYQCTQISCLSNGVVLVYSRCLQFNQFSVPLSLSNMNNVHNTFFVATLIYNVVQHFLSQLKKKQCSVYLLHLTLQMPWNIWINAENNRSFDPNAETKWSIAKFVFTQSMFPSQLIQLDYCRKVCFLQLT